MSHWQHPWDAPDRRPRRNPRTGQVQAPAEWSPLGQQLVAAAKERGSKAFANTPTPRQLLHHQSAASAGHQQQPRPFVGEHVDLGRRPATATAAEAAAPNALSEQRPLVAVDGPFDMKGAGERQLSAPERASLPEAFRYPQCATPVPLPQRFDTALVPASARPPAQTLRRAAVGGACGYSGTGVSSRAPNVVCLPGPMAEGQSPHQAQPPPVELRGAASARAAARRPVRRPPRSPTPPAASPCSRTRPRASSAASRATRAW